MLKWEENATMADVCVHVTVRIELGFPMLSVVSKCRTGSIANIVFLLYN